ncbi:MAG TPA: ABC transporter ATP-binding protein [Acidobacteriota bacterium]|nr:ABC transporter ATP-binding protein [Acidobacteriota bacterium]
MQYAVQVENVRFAYKPPQDILRIRDFRVLSGEKLFIFGPSGSGKTTLLGLLAGVLKADEGEVRVLQRDLGALSSHQRDAFRGGHIGYIFQMFNLIPYLNVRENITLPCRMSRQRAARMQGSSLDEAARGIARALGIEPLLEEPVTELSVGQQQRVAAARSLVGRPEIVIADEPTSSLDADHRERFLQLLFGCCQEAGSTLIFVSHDGSLRPLFDRAVSLPEINQVTLPSSTPQEEAN